VRFRGWTDGDPSSATLDATRRLYVESAVVDKPPRRAPDLIVAHAERLGETGVAEAPAGVHAKVFGNAMVTAVGEHLDPEWAGRLIEIDVLAVSLIAAHVDFRRFLQATTVA